MHTEIRKCNSYSVSILLTNYDFIIFLMLYSQMSDTYLETDIHLVAKRYEISLHFFPCLKENCSLGLYLKVVKVNSYPCGELILHVLKETPKSRKRNELLSICTL